ncbi:hypothetical protein GQ55_9G163900 [Panicum hallii var. hallii]|uniref:Uncharacterized protein n=1 Tax=Panicum hallii var. hallii TaxID=1504633 RepID=A0A2T7C454_9POAL|nr:hypothetical protein GQ55_9G163900 [Panicum hallii var. hallii]
MPSLRFHSPALPHYLICLCGAVVLTFIHQNAAATPYIYRSAPTSPTATSSSTAPGRLLHYILLLGLPIFPGVYLYYTPVSSTTHWFSTSLFIR